MGNLPCIDCIWVGVGRSGCIFLYLVFCISYIVFILLQKKKELKMTLRVRKVR